MLTKTDYANLRKEFVTKKEFYATTDELITLIRQVGEEVKRELREEFRAEMQRMREDIVTFKDEILHEVVAMREELTAVIGHRDMLEDLVAY